MATVKACTRCHGKKIRCSGYPSCQTCAKAGVNCEPYTRHRKGDSLGELKYYRQRAIWLEDEVYRNFHIQCRGVPTGTSLQPAQGGFVSGNEQGLSEQLPSPSLASSGTHHEIQDLSAEVSHSSDIGILALNATGEMRYLGPSSGTFFASYTNALARSCISTTKNMWNSTSATQHANTGPRADVNPIGSLVGLSSDDTKLFLQSYKMWIQPLYPIFNSDDLDTLVSEYSESPDVDNSNCEQWPERSTKLMLFYLVMALGAINATNTFKEMRRQLEQEELIEMQSTRPSPVFLCTQVLQLMDENFQRLHPSIGFIQVILLISIYSSYGPIGSSQWQLAGLAMRMAVEMGLHCTPKTNNQSDSAKDQRNRIFWTIYAIEISLAYNLGRPPSIGAEHIAVDQPQRLDENLLSIHHIRHRQIQSKVVTQIYGINHQAQNMTTEQRQTLISGVQEELDEWRANIPVSPHSDGVHSYPYCYWDRLYHGTTFVLHRSSPLCPSPPAQSLELCIRSAGSYIDDMLKILRVSNVPLSWMLVQGVLFAGLTMLVTARTGLHRLLPHVGAAFLLVDLHSWTRNCSICLAIMNERLQEDLLSKVDSQFELLANDTLRTISTNLTSQATNNSSHTSELPTNIDGAGNAPRSEQIFNTNVLSSDTNLAEDWTYFDLFKEVMGQDPAQTFWDMFPADLGTDSLAGV